MNRAQRVAGYLVIGLAVIHLVLTVLAGRPVWAVILAHPWNVVPAPWATTEFARQRLFWLTLAGLAIPLAILGGIIAWAGGRGILLPRWLPWLLLFFGAVAALLMPVSPFWGLAVPAGLLLIANRNLRVSDRLLGSQSDARAWLSRVAQKDWLDWLIRVLASRRRLLTLGVFVAFFVMLIPNETRWGVVVTLWAVIGAGLLVSVILEEQGEEIQRSVWLRRNRMHVGPFLERVALQAGLVAQITVDVPAEVTDTIRFGSKSARLNGLAQAKGRTARFVQTNAQGRTVNETARIPETLKSISEQLQLDATENALFLSRLTELHGSIQNFDNLCKLSIDYLVDFSDDSPDPNAPRFRRTVLVGLADTSLDLCSLASELREESGFSAN